MHDRSGVLGLIGNTPVVRVTSFDTGPCELWLKLESQNPGGSIKDRVGLSMIEAAEADGRLQPGGLIVEATAGNTGLGLALVAARKGYRLLLVVPDKMSREKVAHLRALGAEVELTRSDVGKGHPDYYQDRAEAIARSTPGAFYVNQFENPANPRAHETTTGPELFAQLEGRIDAIVCGVGSGGTLAGLSRFFAEKKPDVEFVLADPVGSILREYVEQGTIGQAGSWLVEGIGEDFVPSIADLSRVRAAYSISDEESFEHARALLRQEGILAGSSSGTLLAAALRYCRAQTTPKRVVSLVCDSGNKYLSKMFDARWIRDQGLGDRVATGDLRDLIAHPHAERTSLVLAEDDLLARAYGLMRGHDVSQLPVLEGERVVGIVDESDVLLAVSRNPRAFERPVREVMSRELRTVAPNASLADLFSIFEDGMVAIVVDDDRFVGLVTRIDVLQHLRRRIENK